MQLLIVENEEKIVNFLRRGFMEEHYAVDIAVDGEEALYKFEINEYDLVLLDVMIPKKDGVAVCREVRKKNTALPILMLTAKDSIEDRITGLDAGADDYVIKPFSFAELSARVRALLRRSNKADPAILEFADILLNPASKTVTRAGRAIPVSAREYSLLEYFMRYPNIVLSKTRILEHVWDYNYEGLSNIVETYVKYLRKKLNSIKDSKELIHTRRGSGYILTEQSYV